MSKVLVTESYMTDLGDAIREKNGTSNHYKPNQMGAAIRELPDPSVLVPKTITQNGNYDPNDDNADGYSSVVVNVPNSYESSDEGKVVSNGALVAQTARSSAITQNGTYDTTLNNSVTVNVATGDSRLFPFDSLSFETTGFSVVSGVMTLDVSTVGEFLFNSDTPINLSNYSKLVIGISQYDVNTATATPFYIGLRSAKLTAFSSSGWLVSKSKTKSESGPDYITIDLSSRTGNYYLSGCYKEQFSVSGYGQIKIETLYFI